MHLSNLDAAKSGLLALDEGGRAIVTSKYEGGDAFKSFLKGTLHGVTHVVIIDPPSSRRARAGENVR